MRRHIFRSECPHLKDVIRAHELHGIIIINIFITAQAVWVPEISVLHLLRRRV